MGRVHTNLCRETLAHPSFLANKLGALMDRRPEGNLALGYKTQASLPHSEGGCAELGGSLTLLPWIPHRALAERLARVGPSESEPAREAATSALDRVTRLCHRVLADLLFQELQVRAEGGVGVSPPQVPLSL